MIQQTGGVGRLVVLASLVDQVRSALFLMCSFIELLEFESGLVLETLYYQFFFLHDDWLLLWWKGEGTDLDLCQLLFR